LWLILYVVTPFLVPWLWLRNRATDPRTPEPGELLVPSSIRRLTAGVGLLFTALAVVSIVLPDVTIRLWPWTLSPLTARVLGGWLALMGVGCLVIARDPRWSAWKALVESITLWQLLLLVAAAGHAGDFSSPLNWYLLATIVGVLSTLAIYAGLEMQRRKMVPGQV
jgi:peptidoglycan/LPS O-acetylase OafA/YrhL